MDIAYAYFKNNDPDSALAAADRFIKTNPRSPGVDYAYYLKGLVNYNRGIGFVDRFLPTDTSQRDPSGAREALKNFEGTMIIVSHVEKFVKDIGVTQTMDLGKL